MLSLVDRRCEARLASVSDGDSLRAWLGARWAILFSHPGDFAEEQLEMDRWMSVVSRCFTAQSVAPVALARPESGSAQGWLGRLAGLDRRLAAVLTLDQTPPRVLTDLAAAALRAHIARCGPRFAMIIDSNLRCRRVLSYRLRTGLPSPLELIGWAAALRRRDRIEQSSLETLEPSLPTGPSGGRSGRFVVAQAGSTRHRPPPAGSAMAGQAASQSHRPW